MAGQVCAVLRQVVTQGGKSLAGNGGEFPLWNPPGGEQNWHCPV